MITVRPFQFISRILFILLVQFIVCCSLFSQGYNYYNNKFNIAYQKAKYDTALIFAKKALEVFEKDNNIADTAYAKGLNNLGSVYKILGNLDKAEEIYIKAINIYKDQLTEEHPYYAILIHNLAHLYENNGKYDKAEPLYNQAISICKATIGTEDPIYSNMLYDLGELFLLMGNFSKAEEIFQKSSETFEKNNLVNNSDYAAVLNNLALIYKQKKEYERAEKILMRSEGIYEKTLSKDHPSYAAVLNNLASLYFNQNNYVKAELYLNKCLEVYATVFGKEHPNYVSVLNNLAVLYEAQGKYQIAEDYFIKCLNVREKILGKNHPDYGATLFNIAHLYYSTGNDNKAEEYFINANRNLIYQIQQYYPALTEKEKDMFYQKNSYYFDLFNSFAYRRIQFNPSIAIEVVDIILSTGAILLESSRNVRNTILKSSDASLIKTYNKWLNLRIKLGKQYKIEDNPLNNLKYSEDSIHFLEDRINTLEKFLTLKSKDFALNKSLNYFTYEDIRNNLRNDEALIQYISFKNHNPINKSCSTQYSAVIIKKLLDKPIYVPLFEENQLYSQLTNNLEKVKKQRIISRSKIQDLNEEYNQRNLNQTGPLNPDIYSLVWQPIENAIKDVKTTFICPTGLLNKLSFAALKNFENKYISDVYNIHYLICLREIKKYNLNRNKEMNLQNKTAVLFGGIDYNYNVRKSSSYEESSTIIKDNIMPGRNVEAIKYFAYLPGTKDEVDKINKLLLLSNWKTKLYIENNATEENFKKLSGNNNIDVMHLSTHGFFSVLENKDLKNKDTLCLYEPLMRTGLVLAGANNSWNTIHKTDTIEDGILRAYEVSNLDFSNTSLVILSACETGLGDIKAGEGVFGLQRAFHLAGAQNIIMSLWDVPDIETVELMNSFYTNWIKGMTKYEAFTKAQTQLKLKYPEEPVKWAGFIFVE